jgi:hypothetical protein
MIDDQLPHRPGQPATTSAFVPGRVRLMAGELTTTRPPVQPARYSTRARASPTKLPPDRAVTHHVSGNEPLVGPARLVVGNADSYRCRRQRIWSPTGR